MKTKILGKVGIQHKGIYSNTVLYKLKEEVRYGDPASTYRCIKETLGNPPTLNGDNEWWVLVSEHGQKGLQGDVGQQGDKGSQGDVGQQGDKGAQGDKGSQGDVGQQGDKGAQGANGENPSAYHLSLDNKVNKVLLSAAIEPSENDDDQLLNALKYINKKDHIKSLSMLAAGQFIFYDNQLIDKLLPEPIVEDPSNSSYSTWKKVPTTENRLIYGKDQSLVLIDTTFCYASYGGHPNNYNVDWSATYIQFVLASIDATSDQINARLNELNMTLDYCGSWWNANASYPTCAIQISPLHPYSCLYYRMINTIIPDRPGFTLNRPAMPTLQPVKKFGGHPAFKVKQVRHYKGIKYTDYKSHIGFGGDCL